MIINQRFSASSLGFFPFAYHSIIFLALFVIFLHFTYLNHFSLGLFIQLVIKGTFVISFIPTFFFLFARIWLHYRKHFHILFLMRCFEWSSVLFNSCCYGSYFTTICNYRSYYHYVEAYFCVSRIYF